MKATDFEFRNRFWIFGLIFGVGFWLYAFDHINIVQYLVNITVGANSRARRPARALRPWFRRAADVAHGAPAHLGHFLSALRRNAGPRSARGKSRRIRALPPRAQSALSRKHSDGCRHGITGEPLGIRGDRRGKYCFLPALDRPGRIQSAKRAGRILSSNSAAACPAYGRRSSRACRTAA